MKLLTLNTHSLVEENYRRKLSDFISAIEREQPDIIALQEVNQLHDRSAVSHDRLSGYVPCTSQAVVRESNHALSVAEGMRQQGIHYFWTWLPIKRGYGIYDEGIALFSRMPINETDTLTVSCTDHEQQWKTRKLSGIRVENIWFYSVHLGWWDDAEEPFAKQWERVHRHTYDRGTVFLLGDFNSPAEVRGEGYDLVVASGWHDTYTLALSKDDGITVSGRIAGWTHRHLPAHGARVDHIFCNRPCRVSTSQVIFNGEHDPVVSDHFGVLCHVDV